MKPNLPPGIAIDPNDSPKYLELLGFGVIFFFILTLTDDSLDWVRMFMTLLS